MVFNGFQWSDKVHHFGHPTSSARPTYLPLQVPESIFFFTFKSQCPHLLTKEILEMPSFTQKGDH